MSENVTMKDTKATILKAYEDLRKKLALNSATTMNADKIKSDKKKEKVVATASSLMDGSAVSGLQYSLERFSEDMQANIDKFAELTEAIKVKEDELKEMFEIEKTAFTLAALVDSQSQIKEDFEKEMSEKRASLETQLQNLKDEIDALKAATDLERSRDKDQYDYDFERMKKQKLDELNDHLAKLKKDHVAYVQAREDELNEKSKQLDEREEDIAEREVEIAELKATVDGMEEVIADRVNKEVGKAKGMLESRHVSEVKLMVAENKAEIDIKDARISDLETRIQERNETIDELREKLDAAYKEVSQISLKTVEGAGNSQMFQELKTLLRDKGKTA